MLFYTKEVLPPLVKDRLCNVVPSPYSIYRNDSAINVESVENLQYCDNLFSVVLELHLAYHDMILAHIGIR